MKKALKVIVILLIIGGLGAAGYFYGLPLIMGENGVDNNIAYVSKASSFSTNSSFLSNRYSAVIESQEVISVDSDNEKKIKDVFVKSGDTVKKGDKLFEYDAEEMQFQLDQFRLDREQAQAEIKSYKDQIESLDKEYKNATSKNQKLSLENQIEATKLNLKKAEYSQETLEKNIKKLENSIKNSVVKSSVDGMIKTVDDPTASAYITITSSGDFRVKATVNEEHIGDFYVDEAITIRSRTNESVTWNGKVVSIDTAKPITSNQGYGLDTATKYPVYISLDTTDGLLIGQHVTIEEKVVAEGDEKSKKGLWLESFLIADAESSPYVWVENNGVLEKRSVQLGKFDNGLSKYEILSGITGDDYIAFPEERFFEGMPTAHGFEETELESEPLPESESTVEE